MIGRREAENAVLRHQLIVFEPRKPFVMAR
jgi:hypothetical protein